MQYAIIDIEATGGNPKQDRITDIAIYVYDGKSITDSFVTLINPEVKIPPFIQQLTGINNKMVADAPTFQEVAKQIYTFTENCIFVAHNAQFDYAYLKAEFRRLGMPFQRKQLCTVQLTQKILPGLASYSLGKLCKHLNIPLEGRHRAFGDARATVDLFELLLAHDEHQLIQQKLANKDTAQYLPPHLSPQLLQQLPEELGLYYFHNEVGQVIYIGRTTDIARRVVQHFTGRTKGSRAWKMLENVYDVSYTETGSELIAQLVEVQAIRQLRPMFNRRPKMPKYRYGIYKYYNNKQYLCLQVRKLARKRNARPRPIRIYENEEDARKALQKRLKKHQLCPQLCHLEEYKKKQTQACTYHPLDLCKGACVEEENTEQYNWRVHQALKDTEYPNKNFLIIGEGKTLTQKSVVCIEDGKLLGYGYFEPDFMFTENIEKLKSQLIVPKRLFEANQIIRSYLKKNKMDEVVPYIVKN